MDAVLKLIAESGFASLTLGHVAMLGIAMLLIYLAIAKEYEPHQGIHPTIRVVGNELLNNTR
jgi:Na+-transporting methylmalonyl-CoA/oxaloacetate decarboxylase beta subunit